MSQAMAIVSLCIRPRWRYALAWSALRLPTAVAWRVLTHQPVKGMLKLEFEQAEPAGTTSELKVQP